MGPIWTGRSWRFHPGQSVDISNLSPQQKDEGTEKQRWGIHDYGAATKNPSPQRTQGAQRTQGKAQTGGCLSESKSSQAAKTFMISTAERAEEAEISGGCIDGRRFLRHFLKGPFGLRHHP